jgi:hypothetical protein
MFNIIYHGGSRILGSKSSEASGRGRVLCDVCLVDGCHDWKLREKSQERESTNQIDSNLTITDIGTSFVTPLEPDCDGVELAVFVETPDLHEGTISIGCSVVDRAEPMGPKSIFKPSAKGRRTAFTSAMSPEYIRRRKVPTY